MTQTEAVAKILEKHPNVKAREGIELAKKELGVDVSVGSWNAAKTRMNKNKGEKKRGRPKKLGGGDGVGIRNQIVGGQEGHGIARHPRQEFGHESNGFDDAVEASKQLKEMVEKLGAEKVQQLLDLWSD